LPDNWEEICSAANDYIDKNKLDKDEQDKLWDLWCNEDKKILKFIPKAKFSESLKESYIKCDPYEYPYLRRMVDELGFSSCVHYGEGFDAGKIFADDTTLRQIQREISNEYGYDYDIVNESLKESKERKTKKFDSLEKAKKFKNSLPKEAEAKMDSFDTEKKDGSVKEWWEVYYFDTGKAKEESLKEDFEEEDDLYYGKEEADKYKDLILDNLSGKKISKNRYLAYSKGGIAYEASHLGLGTFELLRALEGGCYQGWVKEIDDSTYKVAPSSYDS